MLKRDFYQDPYNDKKVWEVVNLKGGYYLRQYICKKQFGKGIRTTKRHLSDIGILNYCKIEFKN